MRSALIDIVKEWKDLGEVLGLPYSDIEAIKENNPNNVKQCLNDVIDGWFKMKGKQPPSWYNLCLALRHPLVNRKDVALCIEKHYIQT